MSNRNFVIGGIAGSLVGAAVALLLAPKAGHDLLHDLSQPFQHKGRRSHHVTSAKKTARKSVSKVSHPHPMASHSHSPVKAKVRKTASKKTAARRSIAHKIADAAVKADS